MYFSFNSHFTLAQQVEQLKSTPSSQSTTASTITLAAEDSWPPFADQFGHGISHRLIKAAFEQLPYEINSLIVPYSRGLMMAEKGSVDGVFNVSKEESTEQRFVFGNTPLFVATASFYQKKQTKTVNNKWALPIGSTVGIIKSYEYGNEFNELVKQRKLNIVTVTTQQQLVNLLLIGRIDAALMYDLVAQEVLAKMGVDGEVQSVFINHSSNIYLAFSKQSPRAKQLAQELDLGLLRLKTNGKYQQLLSTQTQETRL
ncbi:transporter substrate-binding domain-containing protein [Shewanella acanthi]|nr:transporter substrate-binding domain-containing protein [Shewanella acanthi]